MNRFVMPVRLVNASALEPCGSLIIGAGPLTPLSAAVIDGDFVVYCECDHDHREKRRRVWAVADGVPIPSYAQIYVATVHYNAAAWHLWTEYAPA